jgi:hypothetical protein
MTNTMYITMRVPASRLAAGDRINGFIAHDVQHHGVTPTGHAYVKYGVPGKPDDFYSYVGYVTLERPTPGMVRCPDCGDPMDEKRTAERALPITHGICSECVAYPRRHAEQVARERAVAAFGQGRC